MLTPQTEKDQRVGAHRQAFSKGRFELFSTPQANDRF
jgi:hypothetical protein